jgi:type VI secretion system protein ImpA
MDSDPIDIAALLQPLQAGEQGAGEDLRTDYSASSLYQRLRDVRSEARAEERARDTEGDRDVPEPAGWREVLSIGEAAISSRSKDVEVAAWMTEALVRVHGLAGAAAGARLLAGLCDRYWDALFPLPDEDGLENRASPIGGLAGSGNDGTLMQPLRRLPLFHRADGTGVGVYQWDQAEQTEGLEESRRRARQEAGVPELNVLQSEARLDKPFLTATWTQATAALDAWRELEKVLDARFGPDSPSIRKVTGLLQRMLEIVTRLGGAPAQGAEPQVHAEEGGHEAATGAVAAGPTGAPLASREAALRELDRIAEFFRRTEPHSPLAYTLDEAVRRGRMTFFELLAEVLPDADTRKGICERLGMRPETDKT